MNHLTILFFPLKEETVVISVQSNYVIMWIQDLKSCCHKTCLFIRKHGDQDEVMAFVHQELMPDAAMQLCISPLVTSSVSKCFLLTLVQNESLKKKINCCVALKYVPRSVSPPYVSTTNNTAGRNPDGCSHLSDVPPTSTAAHWCLLGRYSFTTPRNHTAIQEMSLYY